MAATQSHDGNQRPEPNDHIVSKGWQFNFANALHQVAVADVASCRIVRDDRPIKKNFAERGFMTHTDADGGRSRDADEVVRAIERIVLNQVRDIAVEFRITEEHREAVIELFSIHLVRSQAFRDSQFALINEMEPEFMRDYPNDPKVLERFRYHLGRLPYPGEVASMVARWFARQRSGDVVFDTIESNINNIKRVLGKWHLQVVGNGERLPGFVLGDVPVVHADLISQRFGFRDGLAVGDANVIMAPLSPRVLVCFANQERRPMTLTTKQSVRTLNSMTIRVALREVACHPNDAADLQRACQSVDDDLPRGPDLVVKARPR